MARKEKEFRSHLGAQMEVRFPPVHLSRPDAAFSASAALRRTILCKMDRIIDARPPHAKFCTTSAAAGPRPKIDTGSTLDRH